MPCSRPLLTLKHTLTSSHSLRVYLCVCRCMHACMHACVCVYIYTSLSLYIYIYRSLCRSTLSARTLHTLCTYQRVTSHHHTVTSHHHTLCTYQRVRSTLSAHTTMTRFAPSHISVSIHTSTHVHVLVSEWVCVFVCLCVCMHMHTSSRARSLCAYHSSNSDAFSALTGPGLGVDL